MTSTQAAILELFQRLPDDEQRELVSRLQEQVTPDDFYDQLKPFDRAALLDGIAQADNGQTVTAGELRAYMAQRFKIIVT
jgi:hypothetical protein